MTAREKHVERNVVVREPLLPQLGIPTPAFPPTMNWEEECEKAEVEQGYSLKDVQNTRVRLDPREYTREQMNEGKVGEHDECQSPSALHVACELIFDVPGLGVI